MLFSDWFREGLRDTRQYESLEFDIEAHRTRLEHDQQVDHVRKLEAQVERLTLALAAVTELFCERHEITDNQIAAKVREIDLRDGRLDGRMGKPAVREVKKCEACKGINNEMRETCMYCDKPLPVKTVPLSND